MSAHFIYAALLTGLMATTAYAQVEPTPPTSHHIASQLPAPEVPGLQNGVICTGQIGDGLPILITYAQLPQAETVQLRWQGTNLHQTERRQIYANQQLQTSLPASVIEKDEGVNATLSYSLTGWSDGEGEGEGEVVFPEVRTSAPLNVRIKNCPGATYPKPFMPDSDQNDQLDLDKLGSQVKVHVDYPSIDAAHTIGLRWTGKTVYNAPWQYAGTNRPVVFNIPKTTIAQDIGGSAALTYSVGIGEDPLVISAPLTVSIIQTESTGPATATALNSRYNDVRMNCADNKPAYYCNGVIIRSTQDGSYDPWNPSPAAVRLGGVSFSYMRKDAHVTDLYHHSGFIFLSQEQAIAQNKAQELVCSYAYDAGTLVGVRSDKGCGIKTRSANLADLSSCSSVNVRTPTQWYAYTATIPNRDYQCSLSTIDSTQFATSIQVRADRPDNMEALWNEIMVTTWPQDIGTQLPIEAFFWKANRSAALTEARHYQAKYKDRTQLWRPIIRLDLTQLGGNPFRYVESDQAVQP
jgi:hypothetical protein